jgi:3',5'-cyclic AMP phosphodiesterase CpdA
MKRMAWLTDIHLNFLESDQTQEFIQPLAGMPVDAFLLTGDMAEATDIAFYLEALDTQLARPIYFVLGNHDFYHGSIARVRKQVEALCLARRNLHWLPHAGLVPLTEQTCLVGHDGWGDGRLGNYWGSWIVLNDWRLIEEFIGLTARGRLELLQSLGDEAGAHLRQVVPEALKRFPHVVVLTHVPPFREACWHEGRISNAQWLPHFTCKAVGDVLAGAMTAHPDRRMTVLCGHTHGSGETQVLPNLNVLTGGAEYGKPALQRVLEVE